MHIPYLYTFWSSRLQQGTGREHTYSKIKIQSQTKAWFYSDILSYPILLGNNNKKLFKCMHISNGAIFEKVTQACSYSQ